MRNDNTVITQLAVPLGQGAAAGTWSVDDATMTAVILFNALHGVADDAVAMGQTSDAQRKRRARSLANFFGKALRPAEPAGDGRAG
ncbi:hypothetical protein [Variovorax paradoxus]|jgi:hypothetical protein|uniref:TetR family transcriptional regulator n=1 Tax=Variovorax paradoxus TaxID=34073 RepID=A0A679IXS3_VARPD|nr:hypothetical protein VVAX_02413 [Variovorax paradoxus]